VGAVVTALTTAAYVVLAVLAVVSAVVVVWHRNPVVSALALAFNLVAIAGFYLVMDAQFLALLQVIVYAGAIMVLILFVIMLLNLRQEMRGRDSGLFQRVLGPLLAVSLGLLLVRVLWTSVTSAFAPPSPEFGTVASVGRELFGTFFYPFEAISLLLVAAMVGAVLLAKRRL
jgi:NADH-quinone oxidoreductase subunit J